jgi:hypothetical protein
MDPPSFPVLLASSAVIFLTLSTALRTGDRSCEKLSEFLVDIFRLPSVVPLSLIFVGRFLTHDCTSRLSTMIETMSG